MALGIGACLAANFFMEFNFYDKFLLAVVYITAVYIGGNVLDGASDIFKKRS